MGDSVWRRERVLDLCESQDWCCHYCDGRMLRGRRFNQAEGYPSLERLVEGYYGGTYERDNTVAACRSCNSNRPDLEHDQWKILRVSLLPEWPPCSKMPRDLRRAVLNAFGYALDRNQMDDDALVSHVSTRHSPDCPDRSGPGGLAS